MGDDYDWITLLFLYNHQPATFSSVFGLVDPASVAQTTTAAEATTTENKVSRKIQQTKGCIRVADGEAEGHPRDQKITKTQKKKQKIFIFLKKFFFLFCYITITFKSRTNNSYKVLVNETIVGKFSMRRPYNCAGKFVCMKVVDKTELATIDH